MVEKEVLDKVSELYELLSSLYKEKEENKEKRRKYSKDCYNNMTDEQKKEFKIKQKNYRNSLSEEQKEKNKAYQKNYKQNMSD